MRLYFPRANVFTIVEINTSRELSHQLCQFCYLTIPTKQSALSIEAILKDLMKRDGDESKNT